MAMPYRKIMAGDFADRRQAPIREPVPKMASNGMRGGAASLRVGALPS